MKACTGAVVLLAEVLLTASCAADQSGPAAVPAAGVPPAGASEANGHWQSQWHTGKSQWHTGKSGPPARAGADNGRVRALRLVYAGRERLADLTIDGQPARAHSQGLFVTARHYYVTARLESQPRRALLVRFERRGERRVEVADITRTSAAAAAGTGPLLDHPGGFDFDGTWFWIPVAESRRHGRSVIVKFPHQPDRPLAEQQCLDVFRVDDHIGAIACDRKAGRLYGANWDTETVYVWQPDGTVVERIARGELIQSDPRQALAVQDWKALAAGEVLAGGIDKSEDRPPSAPTAVLALLDIPGRACRALARLPSPPEAAVRVTHEGMAVLGDSVFFLPGDLGRNAVVYRYRWLRGTLVP